jgi:hypothetical protein
MLDHVEANPLQSETRRAGRLASAAAVLLIATGGVLTVWWVLFVIWGAGRFVGIA